MFHDTLRHGLIRRDDKDFVVAFQPKDFVIFRNGDANAL